MKNHADSAYERLRAELRDYGGKSLFGGHAAAPEAPGHAPEAAAGHPPVALHIHLPGPAGAEKPAEEPKPAAEPEEPHEEEAPPGYGIEALFGGQRRKK
jgi:hypothetical protein